MDFAVERKLNAPVERIWDCWTKAELLTQWYSPGPQNWDIQLLDVREGGAFKMTMGDHIAEGVFHEVDAPTKLVQGPSDGSMKIITTLRKEGDGTHMTIAMEGLPESQHDMMAGAWNAGVDKLEKLA